MLTAWGFPVRVTEKSMGEVMVVQEGASLSDARHAAWAAGFVDVRPVAPAAERERRSAARLVAAAEQEVRRAESLAWALSQRRVAA
jgi:hypothetical protein